MPLPRQIQARDGIGESAQNPVPDVFVERHSTICAAPLLQHPGSEDGVTATGQERVHQVFNHFGRVLPVAMEEYELCPGRAQWPSCTPLSGFPP